MSWSGKYWIFKTWSNRDSGNLDLGSVKKIDCYNGTFEAARQSNTHDVRKFLIKYPGLTFRVLENALYIQIKMDLFQLIEFPSP